jgi:hypothetical protein
MGKDMVVTQAGVRTPAATEKSAPSRREDPPSRPQQKPHQGQPRSIMEKMALAARDALAYVRDHPEKPLQDDFIIGFIKKVYDYARSHIHTTTNLGDGAEKLAALQQALEQVQNDTAAIRKELANSKNSTATTTQDSASIWRTFRAQEWQHALRNASVPLSQSAGSSTPGITHVELGMDCEIVVKIRDDAVRTELRKIKPAEIVKKAERARADAARTNSNLTVAAHAFIAARQLPSGDVSLRASSAAAAEVLRKHATSWVKAFGNDAWVRMPTWGVVVDGVPVHSMDLSPGNEEDMKTRLIAENHHTWGRTAGGDAQIAYLGWLTKPRRSEGSLVIEFTNPLAANEAIAQGTIW